MGKFVYCSTPLFGVNRRVLAHSHFIGFSFLFQGVVPLPQASGQCCYSTYVYLRYIRRKIPLKKKCRNAIQYKAFRASWREHLCVQKTAPTCTKNRGVCRRFDVENTKKAGCCPGLLWLNSDLVTSDFFALCLRFVVNYIAGRFPVCKHLFDIITNPLHFFAGCIGLARNAV